MTKVDPKIERGGGGGSSKGGGRDWNLLAPDVPTCVPLGSLDSNVHRPR
jgi:hypothetical protein